MNQNNREIDDRGSDISAESGAKPDMLPRKRDREATARALLAAAQGVFSEQGFDAATTREIACRAQVNEALIQRYFGGKAGLLEALLKDSPRGCQGAAGVQLPPPCSLEQTLTSFFHRICSETAEQRELMKVAVSRAILDPATAALMRERLLDHDRAVVLAQLERLRCAGQIRAEVALEPVAHAIAALAFSLGFLGRLVFKTPEAEIEAAITATAHLLAASLRADVALDGQGEREAACPREPQP